MWAWTRVGIERCRASQPNLALAAVVRFAGAVANRSRICGTGRREILRAVYRGLWRRGDAVDGAGRDFERRRETRLAIRTQRSRGNPRAAWKSGLRGFLQCEQSRKYFVVDQSRLYARCVDAGRGPRQRLPHKRRFAAADVALRCGKTDLVGRDCRLELGDEFGLVTSRR